MADKPMKESERHQEIVQAAEDLFRKRESSILRRCLRALPFGLEMAIVAIGIPLVTSKLTGWGLIWPGIAVVLGAVLFRIIRDDYKIRAREWWARKTRQVYEDFLHVAKAHEALDDRYRAGEANLARLTNALRTLEHVLRSDVIARCEGQVTVLPGGVIQISAHADADNLRGDLKALCKYVCDVLGSSDHQPLRCGVLVDDPDDDTRYLIPIVVYDPTDETYVSTSRFLKESDFSGQLLRRFETKRNHPDWKRHTTHVLSDIDSLIGQADSLSPSPISRRSGQESYLKSIAGNIIYCRDNQNHVNVLGVLNIDSKIGGAIQETSYRALQPYLFPAFRLFASRLLVLRGHPELIKLVRSGDHGGTLEGH